MFTLAAIIFALALQESPHSPSSGGSLVGCASDAMAQRLPGVAVVAKSGRVQLTATADASGCYELKDLPSGSYRVTARLPGFDNVTRDGLNIVTGSVARLDFAMPSAPSASAFVSKGQPWQNSGATRTRSSMCDFRRPSRSPQRQWDITAT